MGFVIKINLLFTSREIVCYRYNTVITIVHTLSRHGFVLTFDFHTIIDINIKQNNMKYVI